MAHDHNDIYSIVERLAILEGRITPASVKKGLNPQQKSVPQLPALFKPKHISVLGSKTDPKHPMAGYAVGADESVEHDKPMLESEVAEDVIEKVKNSFKDFIKQAEEQIKDSDLKDKKHEDSDIKKKDKKDRDLIVKDSTVTEDPTQEEPPEPTVVAVPTINPTYAESSPIKSVALHDEMVCEIHGNERDGFEIRRGTRSLPTRFKNIEQAELALEMFRTRMKKSNESQDYLDEE